MALDSLPGDFDHGLRQIEVLEYGEVLPALSRRDRQAAPPPLYRVPSTSMEIKPSEQKHRLYLLESISSNFLPPLFNFSVTQGN